MTSSGAQTYDPRQSKGSANQICGLPVVPNRELGPHIDPHRESLIRYIEKK